MEVDVAAPHAELRVRHGRNVFLLHYVLGLAPAQVDSRCGIPHLLGLVLVWHLHIHAGVATQLLVAWWDAGTAMPSCQQQAHGTPVAVVGHTLVQVRHTGGQRLKGQVGLVLHSKH